MYLFYNNYVRNYSLKGIKTFIQSKGLYNIIAIYLNTVFHFKQNVGGECVVLTKMGKVGIER